MEAPAARRLAVPARKLLLVVAVMLVPVAACAGESDSLLRRLDELVRTRDLFEKQKQDSILKRRLEYESCQSAADRYNTLRGLYTEYRTYRIDSAMIIAAERLKIAREMGEDSKIASASLNLAESYAKGGDPERAIAILDTLDVNRLAQYHLKYRTNIYRTAYQMKVATAVLHDDRMAALHKLRQYTDEAMTNSPEGTRGGYTLRAEELRTAGMSSEAVALIEEASRKFDFSDDAGMQYIMGEIYHAAGENRKAIECLTRAAIIDISGSIKEYNSLILLSSLLFEEGDVDRAFEYINCAFEDAEFSHAAMRTTEIMKSMPVIDEAFHNAERQMRRHTERMLALTCVLVVLLAASLVMLYRQFHLKRKILTRVEEINSELMAKNGALVKADDLKLQHINQLMLSQAANISRLRDYRKNVYRLLKSSQMEKAVDALKSDKVESQQIAAFYEQFDQAFLSIFPDFIEESARYFTEPVKTKSPQALTPELRVAAMIRLGMTSTDEISSILQYTPQTVYNLRSSLKSMVGVPWEEFTAYLRER